MRPYADTSFLVSLYSPDANSSVAAAKTRRLRTSFFLTPFGELELLNALELRVYRRELAPAEVKAARAALQQDIEQGLYFTTPLPRAAFDTAKEIAQRRTARLGTRTFDLLHVASALVLQADTLYSFDSNQRRLAKAEGLETP